MYTVKGILDGKGEASVVFNAANWLAAREKARELRAQGMTTEIIHEDGKVVPEPETDG